MRDSSMIKWLQICRMKQFYVSHVQRSYGLLEQWFAFLRQRVKLSWLLILWNAKMFIFESCMPKKKQMNKLNQQKGNNSFFMHLYSVLKSTQKRFILQFLILFFFSFFFNSQSSKTISHANLYNYIQLLSTQMSESDKNSIKLEDQNEHAHEGHEDDIDNEGDQDQYEEQMLSGNVCDGGDAHQTSKKRSHRKLEISNFIMKTYKILEDKKNNSIVQWTDEGNCFIVKDKQKFSKQILPKFFKHCKFSSFVRQLNMYDFHKIRKEKQIPIFKHKYFQQGRMDLLHKIKRKSGQDGREDEMPSKEMIHNSDGNIESRVQINSIHNNRPINVIPSTKSEIQLLKKENLEIQQSINDISQQIQFIECNREKKKEKLVKIVTSIMFFDLNQEAVSYENSPQTSLSNNNNFLDSLRNLQEHFVKEEQPLSFSQYRRKLSHIYTSLKSNILSQ